MNNLKKGAKVFMAFAAGSESKESNRKLYIGIAPVFVTAVNPNKEILSKFYESDIDEEPVYLGESEVGPDGNKTKVPQVRIDFLVVSDAAKTNGIEMRTKITFFVKKAFRYNRDNTKVQVIDKYGQTAWPTIEEAKAHAIPQYENGPANLDKDYRPAYIGEEELTGFIKAYLNIPNSSFSYKDKNTGELVTKTLSNLDDALARLDSIDNYFKGDFKELDSILKLQPKNVVKACFGVRTTDENKQYQAVYTQKFLKNIITDYSKLDADIQGRKAAGSYPTTEFSIEPLHEYSVESTDFSAGAMPFPPANPTNGNAAPAAQAGPWGWVQ